MTTTAKAKKWTEESAAKAAELYLAKVEADGKEEAATNEFLDEVAKQVGAISGKAVRSKLTVMQVYQKPDAVASVAKTNTVRKEHYVRALANVLGLDVEDLDSLKNAKADSLELLTGKLGVTDVLAASAKGYELSTADFVKGIIQGNGLDVEELAEELTA